MNIDRIITCQVLNDIRRSRLAPLFKPIDDVAKEFLRENNFEERVNVRTETPFAKPVTIKMAICTAIKGETLYSISQKILNEGWYWGTLVDWYHYFNVGGIKDIECIALPNEVYRDEQFEEWYPRVCYCPKTLGKTLTRKVFSTITPGKEVVGETIAEILMKPLRKLVPFQNETQILVVKVEQEKKKGEREN